MSVRQALVSVAYEAQLSDVKTGAGRRTIDIDAGTAVVLKTWRMQPSEENDGVRPGEAELLVARPDGSFAELLAGAPRLRTDGRGGVVGRD